MFNSGRLYFLLDTWRPSGHNTATAQHGGRTVAVNLLSSRLPCIFVVVLCSVRLSGIPCSRKDCSALSGCLCEYHDSHRSDQFDHPVSVLSVDLRVFSSDRLCSKAFSSSVSIQTQFGCSFAYSKLVNTSSPPLFLSSVNPCRSTA